MLCLHPIEARKWAEKPDGTKYRSNEYHLVPCGKCVACLSRRRNEWTFRLSKELEYSSYGFFVTLTYDNDTVPIKIQDGKPYFVFNKPDVQKYLKRVRYFIHNCNQFLQSTYYLVSEYGSRTHRPHYHMLFYIQNDDFGKFREVISKCLTSCWSNGITCVKPIMPANIHYVTKYCVKELAEHFEDTIDPVFCLASRSGYIGRGFEKFVEMQNDISDGEPFVFFNGYKMAMPRIYREKTGIGAINNGQSVFDPRLTEKAFERLHEKRLLDTGKDFSDLREISDLVNDKFAYLEERAKQKQLNRQEKL